MICQFRSMPSLSATCAPMSSCFFACSASDDTGGQDGLRRVGRPSFAAGSICGSATTSDAGSSFPRTHQGTCSPPGRADLVCSLLLLVTFSYATGARACSLVLQRNSVSSIHMRCKITASLRASATLASLALLLLAILIAQPRKADQRP
jgi:hypothetical protein